MDDDGKAYIYNGGLWGGQLEKWKTGSFDPNGGENAKDEPEVGPLVCELADNMKELKGRGIKGVALVSSVFAADDIRKECIRLKKIAHDVVFC